jgi:hypothetical protein
MDFNGLLIDAFGRIRDAVHGAVEGSSSEMLAYRPDDDANSIAWLVWHLTRIQDDHVADVAGTEQVWTAAGWVARFGLPFDPADHGYGHTTEQVAALAGASATLLLGYHDAVHAATVGYLATLTTGDLDRIVDERWDPPVSLAVRLVSVVADNLEHAGQAAYVRGVGQRSGIA